MRRVRLTIGEIDLSLTLRETPTAERIWSALPIEAAARSWGEELSFAAGGLGCAAEDVATTALSFGEIAYRPQDDAVVVCFGETPISAPGEMRVREPVNVWADTEEDLTVLAVTRPGAAARLERESG